MVKKQYDKENIGLSIGDMVKNVVYTYYKQINRIYFVTCIQRGV